MAENINLQVKERIAAAVLVGDSETIRALTHPDFELLEGSGMPFAGIYRGPEGFIAFLSIFTTVFDIRRLESVRAYASTDPDWMVFEFDLQAVLPATGEAYESTILETWNFKDGKVRSLKAHYFNSPLHL